ncbi:MAG: phosphoribosylglycinamide formyltransferase [Bacteroidia bacterium]|nr:phosphoribosylglycinamide formyltransferase [Bacteroidia bacterium]MDW8347603.1 phosphoribosylglycinamide formyltransferase [Bacteroidia bacterium]
MSKNNIENGTQKINLVIFASGNGTNAEALMERFKRHKLIQVSGVVTNNPEAGVIRKAKAYGKKTIILTPEQVTDGNAIYQLIQEFNPDYLVLAGYLKLIPAELIQKFPKRIFNIHPSLLPKYGGKGMYGYRVHEAVKANKEKESGITIHYVNENYDEGEIIFQKVKRLDQTWSAEIIGREILLLEHEWYGKIIEKTIMSHITQNAQ